MDPPGAPDKPLFIYDGQCSFCRRWVARWRGITGGLVDFEPFQQAAARFPQIPRHEFEGAAQLVEPDGTRASGARAVFRILALAKYRRWPLWAYDHVPGFASVTDAVYRLVARRRELFDKLDLWLIGAHETPSTYFVSRWLFLRALGVVFLIAFLSYRAQIDGLVGSSGVLPIAPLLESVGRAYGPERFWLLPTLAWLGASDASLRFMCAAGAVLSVMLIVGLAPVLALVGLWSLYLSLVVAGQTFFNFQWDVLLLEAGLLAIFLAPWQLAPRPSREPRPPAIPLWLIRWLAFRVMFMSGLVKLTFDDVTWWSWTALDYHYWTQPLPTWTSWWAHHAPRWFHVLSLAFMWYAELIAPLFIFGPRRLRIVAFNSIALLQLLILATGNYGFFNLLAIVACIPLVDDLYWPARLRAWVGAPARPGPPARLRWPGFVVGPLAGVILLATLMQLVEAFHRPVRWPRVMSAVQEYAAPFRSINGYGLFRVMTTQRHEIIIEGSDDGVAWRAYEFKFKPGEVSRRPQFCTPHMPRLDWQMWFAALSDYRQNPWFTNLLARLLEGSPPVLELIETNPFPDRPPRYVRAVVYAYRFTDVEERRRTGAWWSRELLGLYCPVLRRDSGEPDPKSLGGQFRL